MTTTPRRLPILPSPPESGTRAAGSSFYDQRPQVRGDCENGPRPCPWVSCEYHLAIELGAVVRKDGRTWQQIKFAWPGLGDYKPDAQPTDDDAAADAESVASALEDMPHTCTLDVADERQRTRDEVAALWQTYFRGTWSTMTGQRASQIEDVALRKIQARGLLKGWR